MVIHNCKDLLDQLESWPGGEPPPEAAEHLRTCSNCSAVLDDLREIETEARSWGLAETEAPERVWVSLRAQLEHEGLIHEDAAESVRTISTPAPRGWFAWIPRPALAGAYLAILVAASFAMIGSVNQQTNEARWLEGTQVATSPLNAELNSFEQNSFGSSRDANPVVTASLQQNLAIVDNYISLCEKSVQEDPQNELARDYLYGAYRQKADLLAQIGERGENAQ